MFNLSLKLNSISLQSSSNITSITTRWKGGISSSKLRWVTDRYCPLHPSNLSNSSQNNNLHMTITSMRSTIEDLKRGNSVSGKKSRFVDRFFKNVHDVWWKLLQKRFNNLHHEVFFDVLSAFATCIFERRSCVCWVKYFLRCGSIFSKSNSSRD